MISKFDFQIDKMCNNFIEDIAWKIGRKVAKCDCVELKGMCRERDVGFQFTSKSIRALFTETEFYGAHGYDFSVMFKNFNYCKEFIDMALCYLHEGNIEKFFLLISHMYYGDLDISAYLKSYAKKLINQHLSCISLDLLKNYYVHVGFGEWNERDDLRPIDFLTTHKYKRFANRNITRHEYISVTLSYWLHVFLTQEKPRTYMYDVFLQANENNEDPHKYLPDFEFEKKDKKDKKQVPKNSGNFNQKLGQRIVDVLSCECVRYKEFQYVPGNIRNILKSFKFHDHDSGFMYNICRFKIEGDIDEDTDEIKVVPLFLDIALCCLYEKDYEEFVNIAGQIGKKLNLGMWLKNHIGAVSYNDAKKYRVNIDMEHKKCWKLYLKGGKKDNKNKKHNEYSYCGMAEKCTDFERYGKPFSSKYLNISFDRFLSDLIVHTDPYTFWQKIWHRGLNSRSTIFL